MLHYVYQLDPNSACLQSDAWQVMSRRFIKAAAGNVVHESGENEAKQ